MDLAMLLDCLAVALGGALGSVCRYLLSLVPFAQVGNAGFPAATLLTNVVGAFAIGVVAGLAGAQAGLDARTTRACAAASRPSRRSRSSRSASSAAARRSPQAPIWS